MAVWLGPPVSASLRERDQARRGKAPRLDRILPALSEVFDLYGKGGCPGTRVVFNPFVLFIREPFYPRWKNSSNSVTEEKLDIKQRGTSSLSLSAFVRDAQRGPLTIVFSTGSTIDKNKPTFFFQFLSSRTRHPLSLTRPSSRHHPAGTECPLGPYCRVKSVRTSPEQE